MPPRLRDEGGCAQRQGADPPRKGAATRLVEALQTLGLDGEFALEGRWLTLRGERCRVFVAQTAAGNGFYTWCDDPAERDVQVYGDPRQAIEAGLRRAAGEAPAPPPAPR